MIRWAKRGGGTILAAAVLFIGIFVLRWKTADPADSITVLYSIPVVLIASRFGTWGGLSAGLLAFALTAFWSSTHDIGLGPLAFVARLGAFLAAGIAVGMIAERVTRIAEERHQLMTTSEEAIDRSLRAERLQGLLSLLSRAATRGQVAEAYTTEALRLLGASRGAVFVLDPEGKSLTLIAVHQLVDRERDWTAVSLSARLPPTDAARTGTAHFQHDIEEIRAAYPQLLEVYTGIGDRAWGTLPLLTGDGVIGAIFMAFPGPQEFDAAQRDLLTMLAQRVADALERATLLETASNERARAEASEHRASLLADVGAVLTAALGPAERMERLLALLVPTFADFGTVEELTERGLVLMAAAHADPAWLPPLRSLRRRCAFDQRDDFRMVEAVRTGRTRLTTNLGDLSVPCDDPDAATLAGLRPNSAITLPLRARGTVLAGMLLVRSRPERPFDRADAALVELIAGRAALALDNAQLYERHRAVAATLQHALLPAALPQVPGVTATVRYRPGEITLDVGGDWYDVIALPQGRVGIVLGDVVGSGVAAAATMGQLRSAVAAIAPYCSGPTELLQRLDGFASHVAGARLSTTVYAEFEPATGYLRYACAGHPPPLLRTDDGRFRFLYGGRNVPLATGSKLPWHQDEVLIEEPATLICYSDGLVERRGIDVDSRLSELAAVAEEVNVADLEQLCDDLVTRMVGADPLDDDVALLCLRLERTPLAGFRAVISAHRHQLARLRAQLRHWAGGIGLDQPQTADLLLATGEACANAVEHAYLDGQIDGQIEVRAEYQSDGMVVTKVTDTGQWRARPPGGEPRGRGLALIWATMCAVEIDSRPSGTTVTMRLRGPTPPHPTPTPPHPTPPQPPAVPGHGGTSGGLMFSIDHGHGPSPRRQAAG